MKIKQWLSFFAVLSSILLLAACGSNSGSGGDKTAVVGPEDTATAGITNCAQCHSDYNEKWLESTHANANLSPGGNDPHAADSTCGVCHNPQDDGSLMPAAYSETMRDVIGCESCHGGGQGHSGVGPIAYALPGPTQCGECHSVESDADFHATYIERAINDTHYDNPETTDIVEGYVVKTDEQTGCQDCHFDGHALDLTIHEQWGNSGHASNVLSVKKSAADANPVTLERGDDGYDTQRETQFDAVMPVGGSDDSSNGGFTHYDWDDSSGFLAGCQKCHTSTGFMNYTADPASYDPANNDFSHLEGWSIDAAGDVTSSGQNELLYCWGCHSDTSGALRVNDEVTAEYEVGGEAVVFPDSGKSNTCYVCHAGRGSNETVSTSSRFAGHHAPAAATLHSELTKVGAEYDEQTYLKPSYYEHDLIDVNGSGTCASCHMDGETPNHEFAVFEKDDTGVITGITSSICVDCHDGEHNDFPFVTQDMVGTTQTIWNSTIAEATTVTQAMADGAANELQHESESYQEAGQILLDLLNNADGLENYKTVAAGTNVVIDNDTDNDDSSDDELADDLRAYQNSKLTSDEKGAYAHNQYYVKQLIFDSIDFLEDGILDGTIADYSVNYPNGYAWVTNDEGGRPTAPQY